MSLVRRIAALLVCAALLAGCGSDPESEETPVAEAYIVMVEWVLAEPEFAVEVEPDELAIVFIESLGPTGIDLEVQVDIVGHFEDKADIRFIDRRAEALEETDGAPVRDGSLLLGLGAMPVDGPLTLRGEVYRTADNIAGYRFHIDGSGPTAVLLEPPERVEPEGLLADQ